MNKFLSISSKILVFVFFGIVICAILFSLFWPNKGSGQIDSHASEYQISAYAVDMTYKKDGSLHVTEQIDVDFLVNKHGIFRALPTVSTMVLKNEDNTTKVNQKFRLENRILACNVICQVESSGDFVYVRMGNPNAIYPAGSSQTFTLVYDVFIDERYAVYDVFYYNILGNLIDTNVQNFTANINFEEQISAPNMHVYVGQVGSITETTNFVWNAEKTRVQIAVSGLGVAEGVTAKIDLPSTYLTVVPDHTVDIFVLVGLLVLAGVIVVIFLKCHNKNLITPVVQFSATNSFTPADVGYIMDKKVNSEDIASLIIYWAQKGFLKIVCEGKETYLVRTSKRFSGKVYEKTLFAGIFPEDAEDTKVDIKKIGLAIKEEVGVTKTSIIAENRHLFNHKANSLRWFMIVCVAIMAGVALMCVNGQAIKDVLSFVSVFSVLGLLVFLTCVAGCADKKFFGSTKNKVFNRVAFMLFLASIFALCLASYDSYCDPYFTVFIAFGLVVLASVLIFKMNIRSDEGCKQLGDVLGLKNFIEVAEKDRLKALVKDNPEMFYEILPYAYVFGLYNEWCKQFEQIDVGAPGFYESSTPNVFDFIVFTAILRTATHSILSSINTANIASTADSISSNIGGFSGGSGGGFSGGGVGGGGVGSW